MKNLIYIFSILLIIIGCSSAPKSNLKVNETTKKVSDTVRIANEELEYEVIIIDGGFNSWLNSVAQPRGFYSESFLENRNRIWITEWNNRFLQPNRFNTNLYPMQINYEYGVKYGYEVNYLIYNYLTYFQIVNKQQLSGFVPRP